MEHTLVRQSKWLSLVLRHKPEKFGIELDAYGWTSIPSVIKAANATGIPMTRDSLKRVVDENNKKRFDMKGNKIRANQGHSIPVDLELEPEQPPETLWHGTARHLLASIMEHGILKGNRNFVHLSDDEITAITVGARHGVPVALSINTKAMHNHGYKFYLSENGIWMTDTVPVEYIDKE